MVFLFFTTIANAETLAVFPLEQAAASERHRGLGFALADVTEADLTVIPGIEVQAPPDLLAGVTLNRKDGIEAADAAAAARDLDIDWALHGSWRIRDRTLDITYELIEARTGALLARAEASGSAGDFVTVEKDAVFALLEDMGLTPSPGIQRRVLGTVQTENFEALVQYGRGRRASHRADPDAALGYFERSIEEDASFDLALTRGSDTRLLLERKTIEASDSAKEARTARLLRALERTPDELELTKRTKRLEAWAKLYVRFAILHDLGRSCQAEKELTHFFIRNDGRWIEASPREIDKAVVLVGSRLGLGAALDRVESEILEEQTRLITLAPHASPAGFAASMREPSLLTASLDCAGDAPASRVARVAGLRKVLAKVPGLMASEVPGSTTVDLELRLASVVARAELEGLSDAVRGEIDALDARAATVRVARRSRMHRVLEKARDVAAGRSRFIDRLRPFTPNSALVLIERQAAEGAELPQECALASRPQQWESLLEKTDRLTADGRLSPKEYEAFAKVTALPVSAYWMGCLDVQPTTPVTSLADTTAWGHSLLASKPRESTQKCTTRREQAAEVLAEVEAGEFDKKGVAKAMRRLTASLVVTGCSTPDPDWKENFGSPRNPPPTPIEQP